MKCLNIFITTLEFSFSTKVALFLYSVLHLFLSSLFILLLPFSFISIIPIPFSFFFFFFPASHDREMQETQHHLLQSLISFFLFFFFAFRSCISALKYKPLWRVFDSVPPYKTSHKTFRIKRSLAKKESKSTSFPKLFRWKLEIKSVATLIEDIRKEPSWFYKELHIRWHTY